MTGKKRIFRVAAAVSAALLLAGMLGGCMGKKAASFSISDSAQETKAVENTPSYTSVTDKNGWKTKYDSTLFDMTHSGNDVIFTYIGEGGGSHVLTIGYHEGKMPSEVLYDVTADVANSDNASRVQRYEGFFNSSSGDWCYGRQIDARTGIDEPDRAYTAVEHNGGTLLISEVSTPMKDAVNQSACDQAVFEIRANFAFTDHQPQKEFEHVVGTYERKYKEEMEGKEQEFTDTIVMNSDHTGKLIFQDEVDTIWSSYEIEEQGSGERREYTIEGDALLLHPGNDKDPWLEFQKKK